MDNKNGDIGNIKSKKLGRKIDIYCTIGRETAATEVGYMIHKIRINKYNLE